MKIDLDFLLLSDPRRFLKEESKHKIILSITFVDNNTNASHIFSESGRFLIFERRGIKTDLFAIERYVEEVLEEVLSKQLIIHLAILSFHTDIVNLIILPIGERQRFLINIQQPISKNSREVLNQL
jgi:hypothetical protein